MSACGQILLQKSKVATVRISGENLKREEIDDLYSVSRATEVAYDFSLRRRGPSHLYTKTEPAALGNFDTFCKTTFATISGTFRTSRRHLSMSGFRGIVLQKSSGFDCGAWL